MGDLFLTIYVSTYVRGTYVRTGICHAKECCGFPAGQLSFICWEGSTVRELQP